METARPQRRRNWRAIIVQAVLLLAVAVLILSAVQTARVNLAELGMTSGFGFLERATGWSYSFSLIERSINDTYLRTLFIGFTNTLFLGMISIVLATLVGFAVGTAMDARNLGLNAVATAYVQVFRNLPLILQLVFWYAVLIHMPGPRQAIGLGDLAFVSNRGVMVPVLNVAAHVALVILIVSVAVALILARLKTLGASARFGLWLAASLLCAIALAAAFPADPEAGLVSVPELKGLRFTGGLTVSIELVAMIVAIVLYGSAYIAEVVRGGLKEVPKGLTEAGRALGLSEAVIWWRIRMPMALRGIVPPLGNQWIFIMKATTLGVAIGFSDLFYIVSTSITQSGQTLELMGLLMLAFLAINYTLAQLVNLLNARMALKGH